jgi:hypothetical protein
VSQERMTTSILVQPRLSGKVSSDSTWSARAYTIARKSLGLELAEVKKLGSDYHVRGEELPLNWMIVLNHNVYII